MRFLPLFVSLTITSGVLSALIASSIQPNVSTLLTAHLSNETISASPRQPLKPYHVPNSPTTLKFFAYTKPPSIRPGASYQTLITALNSIYRSTILNRGDGLIFLSHSSWSYGGATVFIENHGLDRTGQLTWGMLADTFYGVGTFLESQKCWSASWMIEIEGLGNIGSGSIGPAPEYGGADGPPSETTPETA